MEWVKHPEVLVPLRQHLKEDSGTFADCTHSFARIRAVPSDEKSDKVAVMTLILCIVVGLKRPES